MENQVRIDSVAQHFPLRCMWAAWNSRAALSTPLHVGCMELACSTFHSTACGLHGTRVQHFPLRCMWAAWNSQGNPVQLAKNQSKSVRFIRVNEDKEHHFLSLNPKCSISFCNRVPKCDKIICCFCISAFS